MRSNENRLELLKNKKSSISIAVNNTVSLLIAALVLPTTILTNVMIQINNFVVNTIILAFYLILLALGGVFKSIFILKSYDEKTGKIDKAIYDICTNSINEKEIDDLIEKLYL